MKNLIIPLLMGLMFHHPLKSLVDFGLAWNIGHVIQPACLDQRYVQVGFNVNWESNNNYFQIQRSQNPNFTSAIILTNINGCGTCGSSTFNYNDYGPFLPGEVWYYRIKAVSNNLNVQYKYITTPYTHNASTVVNWVSQVTNQALSGSSPPNETAYSWFQESREMQGVGISLNPSEISNIFLEQSNNWINFFSSSTLPFIALDISINNGPFASLYSGNPKTGHIWSGSTTAFSTVGGYNLRVRFMNIGGTFYYREYNIFVVPKSDAFYSDNYCNTIRVWKGNDPQNGTPLILSEGFDAYNTKSQQYYRESGKNLINCLLKKGFNIYIVDYKLNSQSIENNAAVFQSAIRYVSSINNNKKVVATGMSMGGVIARYATAHAEAGSNPLPISKFVSIDAPQQGATLSKDFQNWRKAGLDQAAQNNSADPFAEFASNNDAAKQLLTYNAYDPQSTMHQSFYANLNALNGDGYPHLVESIGIAFSSNQANPNNGLWLQVHVQNVPGYYNQSFYLSPEEMAPGSFLPQITVDPMPVTDSKFMTSLFLSILRPLSNPFVSVTQIQSPTFIAHQSALDIWNGTSKFDKVIYPGLSGPHDMIPASIIEEIVNVLLEDEVFVQNKTISSGKNSSARKKLIAGENVNPQFASGMVNITSSSDVVFKAGEEVSMHEGFQSISGSEFAAIIGTVLCDNTFEYQNRVIQTSNPSPESTPLGLTTPVEFYSDGLQGIEYSNPIEFNADPTRPTITPNPTEGMVYVRTSNASALRYEIRSIENKLLDSGPCNNNSINFESLSKGMYILIVSDDSHRVHTFKVIRQ